VNLQAFDLGILMVLGLLGFLMRRFGLPVLPLVLGVILGPRLEKQLRTSLQLSEGNISGLFSEPLAIGVYILVAALLLWPLARRLWRSGSPAGKDDIDSGIESKERGTVSSS
jgi:putative tricarboxylic transport membrane protein